MYVFSFSVHNKSKNDADPDNNVYDEIRQTPRKRYML